LSDLVVGEKHTTTAVLHLFKTIPTAARTATKAKDKQAKRNTVPINITPKKKT
jgi:hypothetical protein